MSTFIIACLVAVLGAAAVVALLLQNLKVQAFGVGVVTSAIFSLLFLISTAIYVKDTEGGIAIIKFGSDLPSGRIISTNGEKGPQAYILPPGWHFGYMPWKYDLESEPNIDIPSGSVGVVEASDGKPLDKGEVYAQEWNSPLEMLDGEKFLNGEGRKGPQLTVLPPGQYRYNPRLFKITVKPALSVKVGEVVVVKANAGLAYKGEDVELVNGVPIVPNGYRGIWKIALTPNQYYLHPDAYELIHVKTTNRVYSYTSAITETRSKADRPGDNHSINVRTRDGFEFPIDVRAAVKISADDAPHVVAQIGDPDSDLNNDGFDNLEDRFILPIVRAIFRNSSEAHGALEYVNNRSTIEKQASELIASELQEYKIDVDGIYIADIGLSSTPQGAELIKTQTDREVAKQEQETWLQKKSAAESRALSVRAEAEATQEADLVAAEVQIKVAESESQAEIARAKGKSEAAKMQIEVWGGQEAYLKMKVIEAIPQKWSGNVPQIMVMGGDSDALNSAVLTQFLQSRLDIKDEQ